MRHDNNRILEAIKQTRQDMKRETAEVIKNYIIWKKDNKFTYKYMKPDVINVIIASKTNIFTDKNRWKSNKTAQ